MALRNYIYKVHQCITVFKVCSVRRIDISLKLPRFYASLSEAWQELSDGPLLLYLMAHL